VEPATQIVRQARAAPSDVAHPSPSLRATAKASPVALTTHTHDRFRTQVGAFRSAANARRAFTFVSARMSGTAFRMAIVRNRGFYRVLLISEGRRSAHIARARLVLAGWQHFAPHRGVVRT
jgi:cell division protein FtsN